jgi:formylglycine-generating enzyme
MRSLSDALLLGLLIVPAQAHIQEGVSAIHWPQLEPRIRASAASAEGVVSLRSPKPRRILVREGSFLMGSTESDVLEAHVQCLKEPRAHLCSVDRFQHEMPQRLVTLSAFWMDAREVTVSEYARCVSVGRCRAIPFSEGARRYAAPNYPVSMVSFDDAHAYCKYRRARLPTEAEWERAARGVTGRPFPWGHVYNDRLANHGKLSFDPTDDVDGFAELAPVGSFDGGATPDGIFDLAGNVAEWVSDRYAPRYVEDDLRDPRGPDGPDAGPARVLRGGSFQSGRPWLRAAARDAAEPTFRSPTVGFRCVTDHPHPIKD